jgi:hypothetical protein
MNLFLGIFSWKLMHSVRVFMTDLWSFRELYHFVEELFCSLKYCCVVLWTAVMFFEELLLCSLNYCYVLWRTVFQELLFCSFKNCLSRTTVMFFQELRLCSFKNCVFWTTSVVLWTIVVFFEELLFGFHLKRRVILRPIMFIALFCIEELCVVFNCIDNNI